MNTMRTVRAQEADVLESARVELDEHGDIRVLREKPRRRKLPRRRMDPCRWSDDDIRETVTMAYLGRVDGRSTAAIVLHCPASLYPRKILRYQRKVHRLPWFDYQCWGLAWDGQMWANVLMGDEPIDLVRAFSPFATEREARTEARKFAGADVTDAPYFDLPEQARTVLHYAVRRGPGYFF